MKEKRVRTMLDNSELDRVVGGINVYDTSITSVKTWKVYTVKKGDTLASIASKFNCTITTLMKHNGIHNQSSVKPGMTIQVPMS